MLIAIADFCRPGSDKISGAITFTQTNEKFVRVDIELSGVPYGVHGMHVHEKPINFKLKNDWCMQAKGHFNGPVKLWGLKTPGGTLHGSHMFKTERHIGDLCNNIISDDSGIVDVSYNDHLISLIPKHPNCIVGRSVIIHDDGDDEGMYIRDNEMSIYDYEMSIQSKITGNSGSRIACANIISLSGI